ncbi:MAG: hypothetical protein CSA07_01105 [Bacteroidia bacterium]|nr:MAG: hypothetical protein CSA07_01105 [Bacteroidia bacterium]
MNSSKPTPRQARLAILLALLCVGLLPACDDREEKSPVPHSYVNLVLPLNLPQYEQLNFPGSIYTCKDEGFQGRGIFVLHCPEGEGCFRAFDATCPRHLPERPVTVELKGHEAVCPYCNTHYNLLNEGVGGDGKYQLQRYKCHFDPPNLSVKSR